MTAIPLEMELETLRACLDDARSVGDALFNLKSSILASRGPLSSHFTLEATKLVVEAALGVDRCPQPCAQGLALIDVLITRTHFESTQEVSACVNALLFPVVDLLVDASSASAVTACQIKRLLQRVYTVIPSAQDAVREVIMIKLAEYIDDPMDSRYFGADALLQLMLSILDGFNAPLRSTATKTILLRCFAPLTLSQKGNALTGQSETEFYSITLAHCIRSFVAKLAPDEVADFVTKFFLTVLASFNRQKLLPAVGIMTVLERVIDELDGESFAAVHNQLFAVIAHAGGSDYAPLALRGLRLWYNEGFVTLCRRWPEDALSRMLPSVWRGDRGHVDGVVATHLLVAMDVLANLEDGDVHEDRVARSFNRLPGDDEEGPAEQRHRLETIARRHLEAEKGIADERRRRLSDSSLRLSVAQSTTKRLDFVFGRILGFGAYAVVRYAKMIETSVPQNLWFECAVKLVSKKSVEQQDCADAVARELKVQSYLSEQMGGLSGGVVPLWHSFQDEQYFCFVSPFCRRGDVFDAALGERDGSSCFASHPAWITFIIFRVGTILSAIHKAGYYYGDLKPENVLIFDDEEFGMGVALTDFGAAMSADELKQATRLGGTLDYLAPELLQILLTTSPDSSVEPCSSEAWSFGVFCWYIITGQLPFPAEDSAVSAQSRRVACLASSRNIEGRRGVPEFVLDLLELDPSRRRSIDEAIGHSFFDSVRELSKMPEAPPRLQAVVAAPATNTGRKESMMWKQVHIAHCLDLGPVEASNKNPSTWSEAPEATRQLALLPRAARGRVNQLSGGRPAGRGTPNNSGTQVSDYYTVMPRKS